jgi:septal ring factor EnvC (AmiA/AmiB activator)
MQNVPALDPRGMGKHLQGAVQHTVLANPTKYGGVSWSCDRCQASAARLDERMNALEGRFLEVENRVIRSEGVVQEATRKVDNVEARQTKLEQAEYEQRLKELGLTTLEERRLQSDMLYMYIICHEKDGTVRGDCFLLSAEV